MGEDGGRYFSPGASCSPFGQKLQEPVACWEVAFIEQHHGKVQGISRWRPVAFLGPFHYAEEILPSLRVLLEHKAFSQNIGNHQTVSSSTKR